jgi:hypothetical protein
MVCPSLEGKGRSIGNYTKKRCRFPLLWVIILFLIFAAPAVVRAQERSADERALETEQKMTDDERFAMLISVMGSNPSLVRATSAFRTASP